LYYNGGDLKWKKLEIIYNGENLNPIEGEFNKKSIYLFTILVKIDKLDFR